MQPHLRVQLRVIGTPHLHWYDDHIAFALSKERGHILGTAGLRFMLLLLPQAGCSHALCGTSEITRLSHSGTKWALSPAVDC